MPRQPKEFPIRQRLTGPNGRMIPAVLLRLRFGAHIIMRREQRTDTSNHAGSRTIFGNPGIQIMIHIKIYQRHADYEQNNPMKHFMLQPAFPNRLFTMRTQKRPIVYFQFPWPEWIHIAAAPGTIPFCHPSSPLPALWGLLYAMLYGIASRSYFFSLTLFLALFKEPYISGGSEMSPFSIILFYFVAFKTRIL